MKKLHYCNVSGSIFKLPLSRAKPTSGRLIQSTMQRKKFLTQQGQTKPAPLPNSRAKTMLRGLHQGTDLEAQAGECSGLCVVKPWAKGNLMLQGQEDTSAKTL